MQTDSGLWQNITVEIITLTKVYMFWLINWQFYKDDMHSKINKKSFVLSHTAAVHKACLYMVMLSSILGEDALAPPLPFFPYLGI